MKKLISLLSTTLGWCFLASSLAAQDTAPRGPAEWTPRNWLGFGIQIGLFIIAVIAIYKLAGCGDEIEEGRGEEEGREEANLPAGD